MGALKEKLRAKRGVGGIQQNQNCGIPFKDLMSTIITLKSIEILEIRKGFKQLVKQFPI